jgi:hypothetical protein
MDATRTRRTRDACRQQWYALHRSIRFARFLGFKAAATPTRTKTNRSPSSS